MMAYYFLYLALLTFSLNAESDRVMGNWEGFFEAIPSERYKVSAQVISQDADTYISVFTVEIPGGSIEQFRLLGTQNGSDVHFQGTTNLGNLSSYRIHGRIEKSIFSGSFSGPNFSTFRMKRVIRPSPTLDASPPAGATVLYDGTNLDAWKRVKKSSHTWKITKNGALEVGKGNIVTREKFTDSRIHLEFRTPLMPHQHGQARGNSGIYIQGRYEVQVLDSFGLDPHYRGCGAIYLVASPQINATLPPTEWQTYDIEFRAARFDQNGNKISSACLTVKHNGLLVHDQVQVHRPTKGYLDLEENQPAGIMLQDHHNPVQYRNIWILKR